MVQTTPFRCCDAYECELWGKKNEYPTEAKQKKRAPKKTEALNVSV